MKVAFITRSTIFTSAGGDTIQVLKTAKYLRRLNVSVDIKLTHEKVNYSDYNLLHFFNVIRPADILPHIRRHHVPFVVTPLLIDYSEFDKKYRGGIAGKIFRFFSAEQIEYAKTVARWLKGQQELKSYSYFINGQHHSVKKIIKKAALLLPNSQMEYEQIAFRYSTELRYTIIPNGIDPEIFKMNGEIKKDEKMILCVARMEGLKNQLNLIKALNDSAFQLYIIGNHSINQKGYYDQCRNAAGPNVHFIDYIPQNQLIEYYQRAKVHVLPSWFETCGLSSLEAASMGCNVVITQKGYASEYFNDSAFYCDPSSPSSIKAAVEKAAIAHPSKEFQQKIFSHFTWQAAADSTYQGYQKCILL